MDKERELEEIYRDAEETSHRGKHYYPEASRILVWHEKWNKAIFHQPDGSCMDAKPTVSLEDIEKAIMEPLAGFCYPVTKPSDMGLQNALRQSVRNVLALLNGKKEAEWCEHIKPADEKGHYWLKDPDFWMAAEFMFCPICGRRRPK